MNKRTQPILERAAILLVDEIEAILRQPRLQVDAEEDSPVDELGSYLEWHLLPELLSLNPDWPHRAVWCDGVGFFTLPALSPTRVIGQAYSWWLPIEQDGDYEDYLGRMDGVEHGELLEADFELLAGEPAYVRFSIKLWSRGLCHHLTDDGIFISPANATLAATPNLAGLMAAARNPQEPDARAAELLAAHAPGSALLQELLRDPDARVRRAAVEGIGARHTQARANLTLLLTALSDAEQDVRVAAVRVVGRWARLDESLQIDLKLIIPYLREAFSTESEFGYAPAREIDFLLVRLGASEPEVMCLLVELLRQPPLRQRATRVLWRIGSVTADGAAIFKEGLADADDEWRVYAAFSLWRFGVDRGRAFIELVRDWENTEITQAAAMILSADDDAPPLDAMPASDVAATLTTIMRERKAEARVCSAALLALARLYRRVPNQEVRQLLLAETETLIALLQPQYSFGTRSNAISALGEIDAGNSSATAALLAIVRDKTNNQSLCREAALSIIKTGQDAETTISLFREWHDDAAFDFATSLALKEVSEQAVPILIETLLAPRSDDDDSIFMLDYKVFKRLAAIGAPALSALIRLARGNERTPASTLAIDAMGRCGPAAVLPLIDLVETGDATKRSHAAEALGELGPAAAAAIPALSRVLRDEDAAVCVRALEALGRIGAAAVPTLLDALRESDSLILSWAAKALGEISPPATDAISLLTQLQGHTDATVAYFAADALRRIGTTGAGQADTSDSACD